MLMQGLKQRQKVKSPQKEEEKEKEEETKFPLAFHAEDKNIFYYKFGPQIPDSWCTLVEH